MRDFWIRDVTKVTLPTRVQSEERVDMKDRVHPSYACDTIKTRCNNEKYRNCDANLLTTLAPPPGSSAWPTIMELTLMTGTPCKSLNDFILS